MAINRLYIYDPETNLAVCIAKGYSTGWSTQGGNDHINQFYEDAKEFTGGLSEKKPTRYELRTEDDLPKDCHHFYET